LQRIAELLGAGVLGAGAGAGVGYGGKKGVQALLKLFEKAPEAAKTQTAAGAAAKTEKAKPVTKEEPVPPPHPYYPGLPPGQSEEEVLARLTGADEADEQAIRDALRVAREQMAGLAGAVSPEAYVDQLIANMAAGGPPPLPGITGEPARREGILTPEEADALFIEQVTRPLAGETSPEQKSRSLLVGLMSALSDSPLPSRAARALADLVRGKKTTGAGRGVRPRGLRARASLDEYI